MAQMPNDPLTYIGRVRRGAGNRVRSIEVIYDDEGAIHLENGDEFVTFTTRILLEEPPA